MQQGVGTGLHSVHHAGVEARDLLDGVAEAWMDGAEDEKVRLEKGDTIALPPNIPHSFRVVGDQPLRLLGTHVSPKRIEATSRSRASYWPRRRSLQRREWT